LFLADFFEARALFRSDCNQIKLSFILKVQKHPNKRLASAWKMENPKFKLAPSDSASFHI
jgi:hypothetical protein